MCTHAFVTDSANKEVTNQIRCQVSNTTRTHNTDRSSEACSELTALQMSDTEAGEARLFGNSDAAVLPAVVRASVEEELRTITRMLQENPPQYANINTTTHLDTTIASLQYIQQASLPSLFGQAQPATLTGGFARAVSVPASTSPLDPYQTQQRGGFEPQLPPQPHQQSPRAENGADLHVQSSPTTSKKTSASAIPAPAPRPAAPPITRRTTATSLKFSEGYQPSISSSNLMVGFLPTHVIMCLDFDPINAWMWSWEVGGCLTWNSIYFLG